MSSSPKKILSNITTNSEVAPAISKHMCTNAASIRTFCDLFHMDMYYVYNSAQSMSMDAI